MSRRTRREARLLAEQDTVAMRRAERAAIEEMAGRRKSGGAETADERLARQEEQAPATPIRPRRQPRPGKPLKR